MEQVNNNVSNRLMREQQDRNMCRHRESELGEQRQKERAFRSLLVERSHSTNFSQRFMKKSPLKNGNRLSKSTETISGEDKRGNCYKHRPSKSSSMHSLDNCPEIPEPDYDKEKGLWENAQRFRGRLEDPEEQINVSQECLIHPTAITKDINANQNFIEEKKVHAHFKPIKELQKLFQEHRSYLVENPVSHIEKLNNNINHNKKHENRRMVRISNT